MDLNVVRVLGSEVTEGMDEWFALASPMARELLGQRLMGAASRLLGFFPGTPLAEPGNPSSNLVPARSPSLPHAFASYQEFLATQVAWLEARLRDRALPQDPVDTLSFIRGLSTIRDPDRICGSFLHDLAEILTLPRQHRWEYRMGTLPSPPWRIGKLLLEYAHLALEVDPVLEALNRTFCAERCPEQPVGCCHILGYDLGLVPEAMLEIQAVEARWRASAGFPWQPPPEGSIERKCRYHTDIGCVLTRFKSPACLGTLCAALFDYLPRIHPPHLLDPLLLALETLRRCDLDREKVFAAMEAVRTRGGFLLQDPVSQDPPGPPPGQEPAVDPPS